MVFEISDRQCIRTERMEVGHNVVAKDSEWHHRGGLLIFSDAFIKSVYYDNLKPGQEIIHGEACLAYPRSSRPLYSYYFSFILEIGYLQFHNELKWGLISILRCLNATDNLHQNGNSTIYQLINDYLGLIFCRQLQNTI